MGDVYKYNDSTSENYHLSAAPNQLLNNQILNNLIGNVAVEYRGAAAMVGIRCTAYLKELNCFIQSVQYTLGK